MSTFDAIVIGGGANGLVASAILAKGGVRTLLIEAEEKLGGQSRAVEFAPGFFAAPLGIDPGWLPGSIAKELVLSNLEHVNGNAGVAVAIEPGSFLNLSRDAKQAAQAIAHHSKDDAAKWVDFTKQLHALAGFLQVLYRKPAPDVDASSMGELLSMLDLGRAYRGLGRRNMIEFLRTLPLSVWELADDWFECAPLKAAIAATGIRDHQQGPRSGGTGFVLLHHLVGAPSGSIGGRIPLRAGSAAFTNAAEQAARRLGVTIRTGTPVARIQVKDHAVSGVVLANDEEISAPRILSTAGAASTLLDAVDPVWLDPEFLHAVQNVRHRGCTAFVLYALDAFPEFRGLDKEALAGTVSLTPNVVALEKAADAAKYGTVSDPPHVELSVPSLVWADQAPEGKQVLVARVQYAPYRLRDRDQWSVARRNALAESVTATIERFAPGFKKHIQHRVAWTPL
ncbi:MAG TPA: NAD(P)/FAD-dependent oxidoreductase, partial [bacterium]|nr:NAD(P)/FAD-dependent oxidoreductase [bacterium]